MGHKPAILQICIKCKEAEGQATDATAQEAAQHETAGKALYARVEDALAQREDLRDELTLQPVECMNGCQRGCVAALRTEGKFTFVIGHLAPSEERSNDLLNFAQSHITAENGLPAWRERPEHIRKNTLARLHPLPATDAS